MSSKKSVPVVTEEPQGIEIVGEGSVLIDLPIEMQIFRLIRLSGTNGITTRIIRNSLNQLGIKMVEKIISKLTASNGPVSKVAEFVGKERRYKFFSKEVLRKAKESNSISQTPIVELASSSITKPTATRRGKDTNADDDFVVDDNEDVEMEELEKEVITLDSQRSSLIFQNVEPETTASKVTDQESAEPQEDDASISAPAPSTKALSINAFHRRKAFLEILAKEKVVENNISFVQAVQDLANEGNPSVYALDKRTVRRTADQLEKEGLIRIKFINIPNLIGTPSIRTIYIDKSVPEGADLIKDTIRQMKERVVIGCGQLQTPARKVEAMPVERIEDMKRRLEQTSEPEKAAALFVTPDQTPQKAPAKPSSGTANPSSPMWQAVLTSYGWLCAKFQRARALHDFLLSKVIQTDESGNYTGFKNGGQITAISIFNELPFGTFLKVVGIPSQSDLLDDFVQNYSYEDIPVQDLSPPIHAIVQKNMYRYRRAIAQSLEILEDFQVIQIVRSKEPEDRVEKLKELLLSKITVRHMVPLHNFSVQERPFMSYIYIHSHDDLNKFWAKLQSICVNKYGEELNAEMETENVDISPEETEIATGKQTSVEAVLNARNWQSLHYLTKNQRVVLEAYVDRETGTTPLENAQLLSSIAQGTRLTIPRVRNFFRKYDEEFKIRKEEKAKKVALREWVSNIKRYTAAQKKAAAMMNAQMDKTAKTSVERSEHPVLAKVRATVASRKTKPASRNNRNVDKTMSRLANEETAEQHDVFEAENFDEQIGRHIKRRQRRTWSEEEDQILVHAYAIMEIKGKRFSKRWYPVGRLFSEDKNSEICRRRIAQLQKDPISAARIEALVKSWEILYETEKYMEMYHEYTAASDLDNLDIEPLVSHFMLKSDSNYTYVFICSPIAYDC